MYSTTEPVPDFAWSRARYPFAAVMGHRAAKRALLLLAIEPGLRGALIASKCGSITSALARAFSALLSAPAQGRVGSSSDDPGEVELDTDVVELPINVSEDRLIGGLDLDRTIATGKRHISTGLLAQANGHVLYVNDINLLDTAASALVAHAVDSKRVPVEREGLSVIHDADFRFIGTFDSDEGEPGSLLRDRVGLIVGSAAECLADETVEIIDRAFRFDADPVTFANDFVLETAQLKSEIEDARARLPRVRVTEDQIRQISQVAMSLGVEGNRADVFALKAARANAALAGREAVSEDDLVAATQLVLAPRATTLPAHSAQREEPREVSLPENAKEQTRPNTGGSDRDSAPGSLEEAMINALDARLLADLLLPMQPARHQSRTGKRVKGSTSIRGRYVRSRIRPISGARVAIDATLRAAAPFQTSRRAQAQLSQSNEGSRTPINLAAKSSTLRVRIEPGDLRFKEFKHRSGILFIFVVDASGSMALNRMAQAKGALNRLLHQAYLHRDKVALISFRGEDADALLAPTRSVELAKRLADGMPVGGGTPVAAGIVRAIEVARLARLRGMSQAMLVLFTDGRANVGLGERRMSPPAASIGDELRRLGALLETEEIRSVVVDTKSRFVSSGEAEALARILGARYFYLPGSGARGVYDAIASAAERRLQTDD